MARYLTINSKFNPITFEERMKPLLLYKEEYENIIISCTNLPTLSIINELESLFNNNVISSNSCLFNKIKKEVVG